MNDAPGTVKSNVAKYEIENLLTLINKLEEYIEFIY